MKKHNTLNKTTDDELVLVSALQIIIMKDR